jgi:hypothetical protein
MIPGRGRRSCAPRSTAPTPRPPMRPVSTRSSAPPAVSSSARSHASSPRGRCGRGNPAERHHRRAHGPAPATCSSTSRSRFGQSSARTSVIAPTPHSSTRPRLIVAVGSRPPHRGLADLVRAPHQSRGPTRGRPLRIPPPMTGRPLPATITADNPHLTCHAPALPNPLCPSRSRLPPQPCHLPQQQQSLGHATSRSGPPQTPHTSCSKTKAARATRIGYW